MFACRIINGQFGSLSHRLMSSICQFSHLYLCHLRRLQAPRARVWPGSRAAREVASVLHRIPQAPRLECLTTAVASVLERVYDAITVFIMSSVCSLGQLLCCWCSCEVLYLHSYVIHTHTNTVFLAGTISDIEACTRARTKPAADGVCHLTYLPTDYIPLKSFILVNEARAANTRTDMCPSLCCVE